MGNYGEINYDDFRYFSKENIREQLEFEDIMGEVVINFKTREVISIEGINYDGNMYYTQYNLPGGQTITAYQTRERLLHFDFNVTVDGLQASVKVSNIVRDGNVPITNYVLKYKLLRDNTVYENDGDNYEDYDRDSGYWENIEGFQFNTDKSGRYVVALLDRNGTQPYTQEIDIELANAPEEDEGHVRVRYSQTGFMGLIEGEQWYNYSAETPQEWAYSEYEDNENTTHYYIWIPRLAFRESEEGLDIIFLRDGTNIATDDTLLPSEYVIPNEFNGTHNKGIWKEVQHGDVTDKADVIALLNVIVE